MAATKTLEQRLIDFIKRLKELYPDYRLVSDYVNADTHVELIHLPSKEIWRVKPRYLNGTRQAPGVAEAKKPKTKKSQYTHKEYEELFYNKWNKEEYQIVGTFTRMHDKIEILHKKCGRTFTPTANNMIYSNKKGCVHCYGKGKKTVEDYNKIFQQDKELKEYEVLSIESKGGHIYGKVRHNCELCENHEFNIRISDMTSKHRQRCPKCKDLLLESKAVRDIKEYLIKEQYTFEQEKKFDTCMNVTYLPFDFYLPDLNLLIEYDGEHHFKPSFVKDIDKAYDRFERQVINDKIKNQWCEDNNINLLRINYKQDHLKVLKEYLEKINERSV